LTPLEHFVGSYLEQVGGVWEALEPQLYLSLLPSEVARRLELAREELLLAFDPEALEDHPEAQFIALGNPLLDRILADAQHLGQVARLFLSGFDLYPHGLERQVEETLGIKPLKVTSRPLSFSYLWFWFRATLVSDEKEQDLLPVVLDLSTGNRANHLAEVLDRFPKLDQPSFPYPEAPRIPLQQAYERAAKAAEQAAMKLAKPRKAALDGRVLTEMKRANSYFATLRSELAERRAKAEKKGDDLTRFAAQAQTLALEEQARLRELDTKRQLELQLSLINLLWVEQPKLLLEISLKGETRQAVWDPAIRRISEAPRKEGPACLEEAPKKMPRP
jgi:hypothetical protein